MSNPVFTFDQQVRRHLCIEEAVVWSGRDICLTVDWTTKEHKYFEQSWNTTPSCKGGSNSLQLGFLKGGGGVYTPQRHLISNSLKLAAKLAGCTLYNQEQQQQQQRQKHGVGHSRLVLSSWVLVSPFCSFGKCVLPVDTP
jgi:hypothetical protein